MAFAWKQKSIFLDARCKLALLISLLCVSTASSPVALAQDAIRVETNEVLLPAIVYDKERFGHLQKDTTNLFRAYFVGEMQVANDIIEGVVIRDLAVVDFQVLEDGMEQTVQKVTYERSLYWNVRDNRGHHTEYIGPGGGKWSTAEWPPNVVGEIEPPYYLIAYAPPESPEGSCHQIKVKVNRRNAVVLARGEYCNSKHSASDPLTGTTLGKQMESDLGSATHSNIDISPLAIAFHTDNDAARVHVSLDWPWKSLKRDARTIGVLGAVFKKDGSLITRFSDFFDSAEPGHGFNGRYGAPHSNDALTRYERQFIVPPGEYDLRVVLSDGTKFGRAEIPLTVDSYDGKELAISAISLCKQVEDVSAYSPQHHPKLPGAWTAKLPGNYVPLVSNDIEFKPTGNTRFKKGETLYTYFEVYDPLLGVGPQATVEIQIRIVDLKTGELKSDSQHISATPYVKAGNPVITIGRGIDISRLPKGSYRLYVQATDSRGKTTGWRTASFTVE